MKTQRGTANRPQTTSLRPVSIRTYVGPFSKRSAAVGKFTMQISRCISVRGPSHRRVSPPAKIPSKDRGKKLVPRLERKRPACGKNNYVITGETVGVKSGRQHRASDFNPKVFVPYADEPSEDAWCTSPGRRSNEEKLKRKGGGDGRNNQAAGIFRAREGGRGGERRKRVAVKYTSYSHHSFLRTNYHVVLYPTFPTFLKHKMSFGSLYLLNYLKKEGKKVTISIDYCVASRQISRSAKIGHDRSDSVPIGHEHENSGVGRKLVGGLRS